MKQVALVLALLAACCGCKGRSTAGPGPGSGSGSGSGSGTGGGGPAAGDPARCATIAAHVEELYRASAERTKLTDGEIADNVAMVLGECKAAPDRVIACAAEATAVAQLESQCLPALDDEGSEGERFKAAAGPAEK